MSILESKIPEGPLAEKWNKHKANIKVVSPANKRKLEVIVVGTGLGGASAAASVCAVLGNSTTSSSPPQRPTTSLSRRWCKKLSKR